ncbi:hypothetical protein NZD89_13325 [Alicyclobacillus fastidiosus]|uniref:Uncharacterized protein n=1 Tax=Alicyclobacillus fastidiosus TaxID=392011 RepID=A0ABY6ZN58_9BACL|nr:hypothetical protein [Alicyclobacillus fastidiosus]WAH44274.1 hypothetical protein NZD89_13325 [Alicyclobacillus fastidiosus]
MAISITTVLVTVGANWLLDTYRYYHTASEQLEDAAMLGAIVRTVGQDLHSAASAACSPHSLGLTLLSGQHYAYYVNGHHQLIRTQAGGGDAVIGANVQSLGVACKQVRLIHLLVELVDGRAESLDVRLGPPSIAP